MDSQDGALLATRTASQTLRKQTTWIPTLWPSASDPRMKVVRARQSLFQAMRRSALNTSAHARLATRPQLLSASASALKAQLMLDGGAAARLLISARVTPPSALPNKSCQRQSSLATRSALMRQKVSDHSASASAQRNSANASVSSASLQVRSALPSGLISPLVSRRS